MIVVELNHSHFSGSTSKLFDAMRTGVAKDKAKDKNVVHARLKRMGLRFELSLFRDKVPSKQQLLSSSFQPNWLEILAVQTVFSNAAKGEVADKNDVAKAFPDMPEDAIFRQILEKGEVLATLEDRNEHLAEDKQGFAKLAATIVDMTHMRPSKDEMAAKKGGKHGPRLERYAIADIERELKNIRFKPSDSAAPLREQAVEAIHAIHVADNIPILRDAKFVTISTEAPLPANLAIKPLDYKVFTVPQQDSKTLHLVVDFSIDVAKVLEKHHKDFPVTELRCAEEFYIPSSSSDDITCVELRATGATKAAGAPAAKPGAKGPAGKKGTKSGKGKSADSDSDDEEGAGGLNSLEAQLKALKADDSDDDGRGKKGAKKGGAKPAPKAKPTAKQSAQKQNGKGKFYDDDDEDDE